MMGRRFTLGAAAGYRARCLSGARLGLFDQPGKETGTHRGHGIVEIKARMMQTGTVALPDKKIRARPAFKHERKIFGTHGRRAKTSIATDFLRDGQGKVGLFLMVDGCRVTALEINLDAHPHRRGDPGHNFTAALLNHILNRLVIASHRRAEPAGFRNDIVGAAGMDLSDREHQRIGPLSVAADDGLQCTNHGDNRRDGIGGFFGMRAMSATPGHRHRQRVHRRHKRAGAAFKPAGRHPRSIVKRINLCNFKALHDAFLHHHARAAAPFLGGLKDQRHAASEIARLGQIACGPKQHRHMPVMPTGMHLARHRGSIGQTGFFSDRQGINISAQPDGGPFALPFDDRHDAAFSDAGMHRIHPEFAQPLSDEICRLVAVKPGFGMHVQMAAPLGQIGGKFSDTVEHRHGGLQLWHGRYRAIITENGAGAMADTSRINDPAGGLPRLAEIMRRLRAPEGGCPWDIEQDFDTIAPHTIEEAYEVADAIARRDWEGLKGELGDLLFQSVYHAQMAEEAGYFTLDDVLQAISDKMIARHPHVFGDTEVNSAEAQTLAWEAIKARERAARAQGGVLDDVPLALPALMRAIKLQNRAARVGFDWPEIGQVVDKIAEEARELTEARSDQDLAAITEEYGDLLFVMVNLGRHLQIDPETALRAANDKFTRRFRGIEAALQAQGRSPSDSTLDEMDALWNAVKAAEKGLPDTSPFPTSD